MAKRNRDVSTTGTGSHSIIGFCCATAIVLAILIVAVNLILQLVKVNSRSVGIMELIKNIAVAVAVCLGAFNYSRGQKKGVRTLIIVCIIIYLILTIVWGVVAL